MWLDGFSLDKLRPFVEVIKFSAFFFVFYREVKKRIYVLYYCISQSLPAALHFPIISSLFELSPWQFHVMLHWENTKVWTSSLTTRNFQALQYSSLVIPNCWRFLTQSLNDASVRCKIKFRTKLLLITRLIKGDQRWHWIFSRERCVPLIKMAIKREGRQWDNFTRYEKIPRRPRIFGQCSCLQ